MRSIPKLILFFLPFVSFADHCFSEAPVLTATELFQSSNLVCVAKIERVEAAGNTKEKYGIGKVMDVWKGEKTKMVRFRAFPTWQCDTSQANVGETVLLFFERFNDSFLEIVNSGQGQWPLKSYLPGHEKDVVIQLSTYHLLNQSELRSVKDGAIDWSLHKISLAELKDFLIKGIKPKQLSSQ